MALKANYEFLFVGRDDNSFLENYAYDLFQEHGENSGQIFINLEVQNNQVDAEEIGQVVFEMMQREFFADVESDPYERFERALKVVNTELMQFKGKKFSGYIGNLNIVIAAIVGDVLYLAQAGDSEAYLIRKRYVSVVSEGLGDEEAKDGEIFSSIASGKIESGDIVLFSSTRLLRYISKTDLAKAVSKKDVMDGLNELKDVVSTEILGRIGLTGMRFETATRLDVENIEGEVDAMAKNILEADGPNISSHKETLTGKFVTALKGMKMKNKDVVYKGDPVWMKVWESVRDFFAGIFSKGFGKDKVLAALVLVIIVLTIGVMFAKDNKATKAEIERLDGILIEVADRVSEAETKGVYDKEQAKAILDRAYADSLTVLNSGYYREKANIFLIEIESLRDKLDNVQRIESPTVLVDFSEKNSSMNALGFVEVGSRKFVYEHNALYELVLDQVQDPITVDDEEIIISATGFDDRNSVVFLTKSGKLLEYREGTVSFMDTDDGAFHNGVALEDWSNKIYLLDSSSNQIWKYSYKGTRETFGGAEKYLADELDLSKAQDLAIDSNVYILDGSGDIIKLYAGNVAEFRIEDQPVNGLKDPQKIYTSEKLDEVYVMDGKEARVLVYTKDLRNGNLIYKTQYLFDGVGELRDLYVDGENRMLYVLNADKVFEVEM
ncbi:hypothetical protein KJ632_01780 [Patescibacteria group bacterium]|nr:hypothetical protein [Patescibacteria group bacterium]